MNEIFTVVAGICAFMLISLVCVIIIMMFQNGDKL